MDGIVTTSVSEMYMYENRIIHLSFPKPRVSVNGEQARAIFEARLNIPGAPNKQLVLVDLRSDPKPDRDARNFARRPEMVNSTKAMAMMVKSPVSRVLGNFFIGFNRGDLPVKLFSDEAEAT